MRTQILTLALATLLGLHLSTAAKADITFDIAAVAGTSITFTGTGSAASFNFTTNGSGNGFSVTNTQGSQANQSAVNDLGNISGTYTYSGVTTNGNQQTATVTGSGTFTINDGSGHAFTGTVAGVDIVTLLTGGIINASAIVNLTGVSYGGTQADLVALKTDAAANGGILSETFQFVPAQSLTTLETGTHSTSWSGTVETTAVPEPSTMAIAGLGALGMIGYGLRRRKALGA